MGSCVVRGSLAQRVVGRTRQSGGNVTLEPLLSGFPSRRLRVHRLAWQCQFQVRGPARPAPPVSVPHLPYWERNCRVQVRGHGSAVGSDVCCERQEKHGSNQAIRRRLLGARTHAGVDAAHSG
ncbi:hypothetical protein E2C01_032531 [Portunus trituberculatus]|uniref:Uncharacterized protein n=1 Tax=Portunus trituberculatus TaxID=210409 RepID=A0A5B7EXR6_PORTR|nr:hypothetical protein [Portunus trituberculatus]